MKAQKVHGGGGGGGGGGSKGGGTDPDAGTGGGGGGGPPSAPDSGVVTPTIEITGEQEYSSPETISPAKVDNTAVMEQPAPALEGLPVEAAEEPGLGNLLGHAALDLFGLAPGVGIVADAASFVWYGAEGDWGNAGISALGMIPVVGQFVTGGRAFRNTGKAITRVLKQGKRLANAAKNVVRQIWQGAKKGYKRLRNAINDILPGSGGSRIPDARKPGTTPDNTPFGNKPPQPEPQGPKQKKPKGDDGGQVGSSLGSTVDPKIIDEAYEYNWRNKKSHIFGKSIERHNLSEVIASFGGNQKAVMREVINQLYLLPLSKGSTFVRDVMVKGHKITARGFVDSEGVVKFGTFFKR